MPSRAPQARVCRTGGCPRPARLRGFCPDCWDGYLRGRRQAELRLTLSALAVRSEVEEGLIGAPLLWEPMARNLAAWRLLAPEEAQSPRRDWLHALIDTIAETAGL